MKKLNNKGMTSIEILISFIIVTAITISLFDTVTSYKTKQQIESYKNIITEYKNSLTKIINDDIIKYKLAMVSEPKQVVDTDKITHKMTLYFEKNLLNKTTCSTNYHATGCYKTIEVVKYINLPSDVSDNERVDYIYYPEVVNGTMRDQTYTLPDIGSGYEEGKKVESDEFMVKDIRYSSIYLKNHNDNLIIDIAIYHHELSDYYHIYIAAPLAYYDPLTPEPLPFIEK